MRQFNEREKNILRKITAANTGSHIQLNEFLQQLYFAKESKRALILQAQSHYAVFFLTPDLFDQDAKNKEELQLFLELVALLNYLNKNGYVTIYREKTEQLYFFQEKFAGAKASNNSIVLNDQGDYTHSPDTIHDKNKKVIYRGITFNADTFELILNATTGTMILAENFAELLPGEPAAGGKAKNKQQATGRTAITRRQKINLWISMAGLLLLGGLIYLFCYEKEKRDHQLMQLHANAALMESNTGSNFTDTVKTAQEKASIADASSDPSGCLHGVDISKWNGDAASQIDPTDSISFIICKATEGVKEVDADFDTNWQIIKDKGCILGAYHFYHVDEDPLKQAEHYLATLDAKGQTDMAPIVDIEEASLLADEIPDVAELQKNFLLFLMMVEGKCKRTPMIYTDGSFANQYLRNSALGRYPLWVAEYTTAPSPRLPLTWKDKGYKIWQKKDSYHIDTHPCDFDVFYGNKSDLYK